MDDTPTYFKLRHILEAAHREAARELNLHAEVRRMLVEKFTGKQINKRVITYIQKQHPTWTVNFYGIANSTYIRVWGGDSGYKDGNNYGRVFVGYPHTHQNGFSVEAFDACNPHIPNTLMAQEERLELLSGVVDRLQYVADTIDTFNEKRDELIKMLAELPDHYDMERLVRT